MAIATYQTTIENVGMEVGDFKLATIDAGMDHGILRYVRVVATTAPDTDYEIAIWKATKIAWTPEDVDCIYWRKGINAGKDWMAGDHINVKFNLDNSLGTKFQVGIKATTAGTTDDYTIEVDVEAEAS